MGQPNYTPLLPTSTTLDGTPTATPVPTATPATATPNTDLRGESANQLVVTWTKTEIKIGPTCGDPGALTNWDGADWGHAPALAVPAPAGAGRLVQIALNQLGKPYVWGAKGPEQFDCSGLTQWSYAQIGIHIPTGTAGQWPLMRPVTAAELQPGDLIFFSVATPGKIDHVGMLVGDLNGDGKWDMVHAATPQLGCELTTMCSAAPSGARRSPASAQPAKARRPMNRVLSALTCSVVWLAIGAGTALAQTQPPELARAITTRAGVVTFSGLWEHQVRVAIVGRLLNGTKLYQAGNDAQGIALLLDLAPTVLDLRSEADGMVVPDPVSMAALEMAYLVDVFRVWLIETAFTSAYQALVTLVNPLIIAVLLLLLLPMFGRIHFMSVRHVLS